MQQSPLTVGEIRTHQTKENRKWKRKKKSK